MKARLSLLAALAVLPAMLLAPAAGAQNATTPMKKKVALTGEAENGRNFRGTYTIDRFTRSRSGRLVAVGTVRGRLGRRAVRRRNVVMPASVVTPAQSSQLPPIPGACEILNLRLGPITLDLLGLVVRTNRINVRIDAVPGQGNLLGNLLCAITGIFDPQAATTGQRAAVLNAILALVPQR